MIIHLILGSNDPNWNCLTVIMHNKRAYWYQSVCYQDLVNLLNVLNFNARDDNHHESCLTCQL